MGIFDLPIDELEMCGGYEHYTIVHVYRNRDAYLAVIQNRLNGAYTSVFITDDGVRVDHSVVVCRPKKRKKTFIKTLKELVDSGWVWQSDGMWRHPKSELLITPGMAPYLE